MEMPDGLTLPPEYFGAADSPTPQFALLGTPASDLDGKPIPAREWHVDGLIPGSTVTLLSGDGGTGKSLLALQLAVATAAGTGWVGRAPRQGPAVFISAEDDADELHRRLADVVAAEGIGFHDLADLHFHSLAGEDALLASLERDGTIEPNDLFDRLDRTVAAVRPALVVLDTLADVFPGDEIKRTQARQFVALLRGLAIKHRCAVVLLSHPSLTGMNSGTGTSGSTAWSNSVRSRLYMERVVVDGYEANPDARRLTTKKANYGRIGTEIPMQWKNGVFIADAPTTLIGRLAASNKAERVFLYLLQLVESQGRRVNATGGPNYAPKLFAEHPDAEGVNRRAFKAAMEGLLQAGKVVVDSEGPPSRRVTFLRIGKP